MCSAATGSVAMPISAMCSTPGSGMLFVPLLTSIVHSIGTLAAGTSASISATPTAITYTLDVPMSMPPIMEVMACTTIAIIATMPTVTTTIARHRQGTTMLACVTIGIMTGKASLAVMTTALLASRVSVIATIVSAIKGITTPTAMLRHLLLVLLQEV